MVTNTSRLGRVSPDQRQGVDLAFIVQQQHPTAPQVSRTPPNTKRRPLSGWNGCVTRTVLSWASPLGVVDDLVQRRGRVVFRHHQTRAHHHQGLAQRHRAPPGRVQLHRGLVQHPPPPQLAVVPEPGAVGSCPPQQHRHPGGIIDSTNLSVKTRQLHGKSFLACALANSAIRQGHTALYLRTPRLLDDLALGRSDGRYARTLTSCARSGVLVLDDFLLSPAPVEACRDLLEVVEDRSGLRSTLVVSQLPVDKWHPAMADPTLASVLLDRPCQAARPHRPPGRLHAQARTLALSCGWPLSCEVARHSRAT